jgi:DNA-directed RNA polymerase specialized sigma subunit
MDKTMAEAIEAQQKLNAIEAEAKIWRPKRNKLVAQLSKKHTRAQVARALGLTSQRVIQILNKADQKKNKKVAATESASS